MLKVYTPLIIFVILLMSRSVSAQTDCNDGCFSCLFGASIENKSVQAFLRSHFIDSDNYVSQLSSSSGKVGYLTENGRITGLTFYGGARVPIDLTTYLNRDFGLFYSYEAENDKSLTPLKKIDGYEITISGEYGKLQYIATYGWNGYTKKDRDFGRRKLEIELRTPSEYLDDGCKEVFKIPDPAYEGNNLFCLLNQPTSMVMDALDEWGLKNDTYPVGARQYYGKMEGGIIFQELNGKIVTIELYVRNFPGKLPMGIQLSDNWEAIRRKVGLAPFTADHTELRVNYHGLIVDFSYSYEYTRQLVMRISSAMDNDEPVCREGQPLDPLITGCLNGDCENGYGRIRFSDPYDANGWEYEGHFKNGLFDGDGCEIHGDNYSFAYYENGERTGWLSQKMCVDNHCEDPEEMVVSTDDVDWSNVVVDVDSDKPDTDNHDTDEEPLTEKEETVLLVKYRKEKMESAGWKLLKEKDYKYQFNSLWQEISFTARPWKSYRAQIISASKAPEHLEYAYAILGREAQTIHERDNVMPGTLNFTSESQEYSGGMQFWWRATVGYMVDTPITVLIWEK